jgi:hypothetical protein
MRRKTHNPPSESATVKVRGTPDTLSALGIDRQRELSWLNA